MVQEQPLEFSATPAARAADSPQPATQAAARTVAYRISAPDHPEGAGVGVVIKDGPRAYEKARTARRSYIMP